MTEAALIAAAQTPRTRATLAVDLTRLGVRPGETLLVHSSLSALGWTVGDEQAVVQALLDTLGPDGTLVVPSHSGGNSDPMQWQNPPVPPDWWPVIRAAMPAYDPATSPTRGMGRIPEAVRRWPGAVRSPHPQHSFAAIGPAAAAIVSEHPLDGPFGERSPLAKLEAAGARVLLLGVGFDSCTCLHLAELRLPGAPTEEHGCAVLLDGERRWVTYTATVADSDDFAQLGAEFEQRPGAVTRGLVGSADSRLFGVAEVVEFGLTWLGEHRASPGRAGQV